MSHHQNLVNITNLQHVVYYPEYRFDVVSKRRGGGGVGGGVVMVGAVHDHCPPLILSMLVTPWRRMDGDRADVDSPGGRYHIIIH